MNQRATCSRTVPIVIAALGCASPTVQADNGPLRMTVEIKHTTIYMYEALPITVIFRNTGESEFPVHDQAFSLGRGVGTVALRDQGGAARVFRSPRYIRGTSHEGYWPALKPGEEHRISFLLSCDESKDRQPIFTSPGKYTLTVEYEDRAAESPIDARSDYPDVHITSGPLVIEVLQPPPHERRALELVARFQHSITLYEPNAVPITLNRPGYKQAWEELRAIASIEASQVYANYARYTLAGPHVRRARIALQSPQMFDINAEIEAAHELLNAIDTEGFTLANRVTNLRAELDRIVKAHEDRIADHQKQDTDKSEGVQ